MKKKINEEEEGGGIKTEGIEVGARREGARRREEKGNRFMTTQYNL